MSSLVFIGIMCKLSSLFNSSSDPLLFIIDHIKGLYGTIVVIQGALKYIFFVVATTYFGAVNGSKLAKPQFFHINQIVSRLTLFHRRLKL